MLSILIPHYNKNIEGIDQVLGECLMSFAGKAKEIVTLLDNDKSQYQKLNIGMKMTTQPFVLVTNNDTRYISGDLDDLCVDGVVTRPLLDGAENRGMGHCFCLPKSVWELVGGFDESYEHGYFDDNDFVFSLEKHNIPIQLITTVNIHHPEHGGTTLQKIQGIGDVFERNKQRFISKWGRTP